jgi:structure-specific endonuclease subunit SLX1
MEEKQQKYYVYCLQSSTNETYVGATVDIDRRLRQHNCELVGGARRTGAIVSAGGSWQRICHVTGFPSWQTALQFEWRWKQITRKQSAAATPIERRMHALKKLLELDRPTTKAIPYIEWQEQPVIVWESDEAEYIWISLRN